MNRFILKYMINDDIYLLKKIHINQWNTYSILSNRSYYENSTIICMYNNYNDVYLVDLYSINHYIRLTDCNDKNLLFVYF